MSVLIFIDHSDGHIKKTSLEALSYGLRWQNKRAYLLKAFYWERLQKIWLALGKYGDSENHQVTRNP